MLGLGGIGLNAIMAAKLSGASRIIGIDIHQGKFPLAKQLGCTDTAVANDPELVETVRNLTLGGVDYAFEISGAKPAMAIATAVTRKGGEVICVGLGAFEDLYQYSHAALVSEEKAFRGSLMGSCVPERDIPRYTKLYLEGKLPVDRLKSGVMGFADLNANLDALDRGEVVRQVLLPHG